MRAVVYARYSSDNQSETSIEDQIRQCRTMIEREGWTYVTTYSDRAISGSTLILRPGVQALIADARNHDFDVIVAEALDRLSRDQADVATLYKQARFFGIKLITVAEGEINELHVGLKGTMNALFLKDLAQKTRRGMEGKVLAGKSAGGRCNGYDVVRSYSPTGEPVRGDRAINPAEAEIVRRVFREFAAGISPRQIAKRLNTDGILGPDGGAWRDTTIRGHNSRGTGLINNELYIGRLVWNRLTYVKDPDTGKRVSRLNPASAHVVEEVPELRIVDDGLWQQVKNRQDKIAATPGVEKLKAPQFWTKRRAQHLLTGKCICGACRANYVGVGKDYLGCSSARGAGTCENRQLIRRTVLDDLIFGALKERMMSPELTAEFIAAFHEEENRRRAGAGANREAEERELSDVTRKIDRLIDAITEGLRTESTKAKLLDLEARKAALTEKLSGPPPSPLELCMKLGDDGFQAAACSWFFIASSVSTPSRNLTPLMTFGN
jgi:site-specific DNA recombinase